MSSSYTYSQTTTFTATHAKYLASKVATDLKRIQRLYGGIPNDTTIASYEAELIEFLKRGFLSEVTYGFQRDGKWIEPTLRYNAIDLSQTSSNDDDPGKIRPGANISAAVFKSYLITNTAYANLSAADKSNFESSLPFNRTGAPAPGANGYLSSDKSYSSGGKGLDRSSLKNY
jgi:hypothetical protein